MKKAFFLFTAAILVLFACTAENDNNHKEVIASAIKLSKNKLTMITGGNESLTVAYTPSNTTKKDIVWTSTDKKVATVADGKVVGVAAGKAVIVAVCGNATDQCEVEVLDLVVDMGLSVNGRAAIYAKMVL